MTLTEKEANAKGYTITRGDYTGTYDNRSDRWYINDDSRTVDRTGKGFASKAEALQRLTEQLTHIAD